MHQNQSQDDTPLAQSGETRLCAPMPKKFESLAELRSWVLRLAPICLGNDAGALRPKGLPTDILWFEGSYAQAFESEVISLLSRADSSPVRYNEEDMPSLAVSLCQPAQLLSEIIGRVAHRTWALTVCITQRESRVLCHECV